MKTLKTEKCPVSGLWYRTERLETGTVVKGLVLDQFVGRIYAYGRHGAIQVVGYQVDPPLLRVRSILGDTFFVTAKMLEGRQQNPNEMEILALIARGRGTHGT